MCNYLMIDLSKFLSNFPHDMTEKTEETEQKTTWACQELKFLPKKKKNLKPFD